VRQLAAAFENSPTGIFFKRSLESVSKIAHAEGFTFKNYAHYAPRRANCIPIRNASPAGSAQNRGNTGAARSVLPPIRISIGLQFRESGGWR
jgi:hypothetical protein